MIFVGLVIGLLISPPVVHGTKSLPAGALDVLHYSATIEPDIADKSVKGTVRIRFSTDSQQAEFDCGAGAGSWRCGLLLFLQTAQKDVGLFLAAVSRTNYLSGKVTKLISTPKFERKQEFEGFGP